jgi:uncharacterized protein (TIGR04255 family)
MGAFQRGHVEFPTARISNEDDDGQTVLLLDEAKTKGVAISSTMLSAITYSYVGGFATFQEWAKPILDEALAILDLPHYSGVAYRYENVIEGIDASALDRMVTIKLPAPATAFIGKRAYLHWQQTWPHGEVVVTIVALPEDSPTVKIDISARHNEPVNPADLNRAIAEAHRMGRLAVEGLITNEFREQLRKGKA